MSRQTYPAYKPSGVEWLGDVPEHWEARRLKTVARFGYGDSLAADDRAAGPYSVYGSNGVVGEHDRANTKAPCLIIGRKGSFGKVAYSDTPCFAIDTTYFVDPRLSSSDLRWLYYCLQWLRLDSFSKDSAVPGLSREDAYNNMLAICPLDEQRAIVRFLDRETVRIDALIEKKRRQIELLHEKRAALISHAVTKGLDPNAPMKDSGIERLGEIPAHWDVKRLKFLVVRNGVGIQMGPFGTMIKDLDPVDTGFKVYGQENVISGDFAIGERWVDAGRYDVLRHYAVEPGDILLTRKGSIGNARLFPRDAQRGIIDSDTIRVRVDEGQMDRRFLVRLLHDAAYLRQQFEATRRGAILSGLNTTTIAELQVCTPPLGDQELIREYVDGAVTGVDALIVLVETSIDRLREYRTALISAAVTGKIDVRGK